MLYSTFNMHESMIWIKTQLQTKKIKFVILAHYFISGLTNTNRSLPNNNAKQKIIGNLICFVIEILSPCILTNGLPDYRD